MNTELLQEKRINKGIKSIQMADYLGIRKETYSRKENGKKSFSKSEKIALAVILGLNEKELIKIFGDI